MNLSLGRHCAAPGHTPQLRQHAVVNPRATTAAVPRQVVGFVTVTEDQKAQSDVSELLEAGGVVTLKERVMQTAAFKTFQESINNRPALQSDWLSFTSRPWVQGPVDAFLGNTQLAAMMSQHKELAATVEGLVRTVDAALIKGGHMPWLLHVVRHVADHSGMYVIMQAVEEMLGPHHIARLERLTYASLTRPRAVKLMAVLVALLTPETLEGTMQLLRVLLTDERLTRWMDAAEYVVSDEERIGLAALALDSLSDGVSDESILHLIATLDTQVDLQLLVRTGQDVLQVLLQDPVTTGERIGGFLDAVADLERLERTVQRNDEVMTLERIAVLHKVLAQVSPTGSPENVTAGIRALRAALTSHSAHSLLLAASSAVTAGELRAWWQAFDASLTTQHIEAALDAVEAGLDGGRIWALMGQPQPALEMLLIADEEARAATCRSKCGSGSVDHHTTAADAQPAAGTAAAKASSVSSQAPARARGSGGSGRLSLSSRDEWTISSMASMDDIGTASSSSSGNGGGSLSTAAAAAAAAANAAAEAAAVAPACALDDRDCQDCSGRCGSPVERAFASGSHLSDPDLAALIRGALRDIRPYRLARQRAAAQANAQQAVAAAAGAAGGTDQRGPAGAASSGVLASVSSWDDWVGNSSMLASLDLPGHYTPGSPLGSLHAASATDALPTDARENAGTAAAAAVAVAAAAAASQGGTCSLSSPQASNLTLPDLQVSPTGSSSSGNQDGGDDRQLRMAVAGVASLARAAFKPRRLRSFFDLATELLDPQRLAIAMAVLDNTLRIGEHSVAVGPVCEISSSSSSSSSSGGRLRSGSNGLAAAGVAAAALVAALPAVVSQKFIDAAVGAAADLAEGVKSRTTLLHAADTVLALATLQQDMQLRQQQQQQQQQQGNAAAVPGHVPSASEGPAPAEPQKQLQQAAAVMQCALGDPHSCVAAEELAAAAAASRSSGSNGNTMQLLATLFGLHVTLLKDLGSLWWAYHSRLALNLGSWA